MEMNERYERPDSEFTAVFRLFFDGDPVCCRKINTSRAGGDFRETVIAVTAAGDRYVIKLADNDFTFPERIAMWQRTAEEYRTLGCRCPKIYCDKRGGLRQ